MNRPTLYLFIGYPGAGKTTVAQIIAEATGATHLWADVERHKMFREPTHSEQESIHLYEVLNRRAADLLAAGGSVVFDTNFNFYKDRQKLRDIAKRAGAETIVLWIVVPPLIAKRRAVGTAYTRNGYKVSMPEERFKAIVSKLDTPHKDEKVIKMDGTKLDRTTVLKLLNL